MGQIDRPADRDSLLPYGRPNETPASIEQSGLVDLADDDPMAAARGAVNGVLLGAFMWTVLLWALV
jgi:hypothetical protein